jgi:hypothetical protein
MGAHKFSKIKIIINRSYNIKGKIKKKEIMKLRNYEMNKFRKPYFRSKNLFDDKQIKN